MVPIGSHLPGIDSSEIAAITEVPASSSGTLAGEGGRGGGRGAEDEDQQDEGDRQRGDLRLAEVLADHRPLGAVEARVAGFGDGQARVLVLDARDGVERADDGLVIVVRVARHVEGDERGVASHQWRADLRG
jgi:hypothetical protein